MPSTPTLCFSKFRVVYHLLRKLHLKNLFPVLPPCTDLSQLVDDHRNQSSVDHSLDLLLVPSCDVGQEPDRLLQTHQSQMLKTSSISSLPLLFLLSLGSNKTRLAFKTVTLGWLPNEFWNCGHNCSVIVQCHTSLTLTVHMFWLQHLKRCTMFLFIGA